MRKTIFLIACFAVIIAWGACIHTISYGQPPLSEAADGNYEERIVELRQKLQRATSTEAWWLVLDIVRHQWMKQNFDELIATIEEAIERFGECVLHPLVKLRYAQAILGIGRTDDALKLIQELEWMGNSPYKQELKHTRWIAELASDRFGMIPQFVGDDKNTDGYWAGTYGTAGACIFGPRQLIFTYGLLKGLEWSEFRVLGKGACLWTVNNPIPSDESEAVYAPSLFCKINSPLMVWSINARRIPLCIRVTIPKGAYRLSVLTKGFAIDMMLEWLQHPIASARARKDGKMVYRQFLVFGPATYLLKIHGRNRQAASVSAIFLDEVGPATLINSEGLKIVREIRMHLKRWMGNVRKMPNSAEKLIALSRTPARLSDRELHHVASEFLKSVEATDKKRLKFAIQKCLKHPSALKILLLEMCNAPQTLKTIDGATIYKCAVSLGGVHDLITLEAIMETWASVVKRYDAIEALESIAARSPAAAVVAAIHVLAKLNAVKPRHEMRLRNLLQFQSQLKNAFWR